MSPEYFYLEAYLESFVFQKNNKFFLAHSKFNLICYLSEI